MSTTVRRRSATAVSTYVFERIMPDAFVLPIGLTALVMWMSYVAALWVPV